MLSLSQKCTKSISLDLEISSQFLIHHKTAWNCFLICKANYGRHMSAQMNALLILKGYYCYNSTVEEIVRIYLFTLIWMIWMFRIICVHRTFILIEYSAVNGSSIKRKQNVNKISICRCLNRLFWKRKHFNISDVIWGLVCTYTLPTPTPLSSPGYA